MEHIRAERVPPLRNPALIGAFAGWNDAAQVASSAIQYLLDQWSAVKLAEIDPEDFFVFTETRPLVRLAASSFERQVEWPALRFYVHADSALPRDIVLLSGTEPQLKWRTFTSEVVSFLRSLGVTTVVCLGGMIADVPHSGQVRLTGSGTSDEMATRIQRLGIQISRYEGPTGIVGVLTDAASKTGIAAGSLWGVVPHYISATPNPKVAVALLRHLGALLDLPLQLGDLETAAAQFEAEVDDAIARNPEAAAYVRQLVEHGDEDADEESEPPSLDLPSGQALIEELERYLRRERRNPEAGG